MLKKGIIALCLMLAAYVSAANESGVLKKANDLYADGDFVEAIAVYESIVDSGLVSGHLFYNLGNAYYKTGMIAPAILNYERAMLYLPGNENLNYNLEMSQKMVVDKIEMVDVFFLKRWVISFGDVMSSDNWTILGITSFFLFIGGLALYTFSGRSGLKRFGFFAGVIMLLITAVGFSYSGSQKKVITQQNGAIIFSPTVTVKGAPNESGTDLFILHEGTKVHVTDSLGNWNEIVLGDGNVGWIEKSALRRI